jgi:hypothetical protein
MPSTTEEDHPSEYNNYPLREARFVYEGKKITGLLCLCFAFFFFFLFYSLRNLLCTYTKRPGANLIGLHLISGLRFLGLFSFLLR